MHAATIARQVALARSALGVTRQAEPVPANPEINDPIGNVLDLELERLNQLQAALWDRATCNRAQFPNAYTTDEQDRAVDRVLKILERRHKLLGLEKAPSPVTRAEPESSGDHRFIVEIAEPLRPCPPQQPSDPQSGDSSPPTDDPGIG